jgi:hypothetical protein
VNFAREVGLQGVTTDPRDVGFPQISTRTANFGRIFSAKNPREMQFGAKLSF